MRRGQPASSSLKVNSPLESIKSIRDDETRACRQRLLQPDPSNQSNRPRSYPGSGGESRSERKGARMCFAPLPRESETTSRISIDERQVVDVDSVPIDSNGDTHTCTDDQQLCLTKWIPEAKSQTAFRHRSRCVLHSNADKVNSLRFRIERSRLDLSPSSNLSVLERIVQSSSSRVDQTCHPPSHHRLHPGQPDHRR